ncbi:hypothetical protein SLE2022_159620 [Rubroshorea leprosula]
MRLSLAIHLLILAMLLSQAQGFRLGKRLLSIGHPKFSVGHPKLHEAAQMKKINDGMGDVVYCKKERCTGTLKRKVSGVMHKSSQWLPNIHEDYYGPRKHRPTHH